MQSNSPQPKPFHVLLFATYPALALLAANASQIAFTDVLRPLFISWVLAGAIYAVFRLLLRPPARAALATTLTLMVLFSYGHLYNGLKLIGLPGDTVVRHRFLLPVVLGILAITLFLVARSTRSRQVVSTLNLMGLVAIALPAATLLLTLGKAALASSSTGGQAQECSLHPPPGAALPDIYFIVMDAYERDDVLRQMHGSDITPFLESLERRGFYIPRGAMSNYRHTELSLSSILNMDYVQSLLEENTTEDEARWKLVKMIPDNRLRRELECLGYSTVGIETGVSWTEWDDADYFIAQDTDPLHNAGLVGSISPFEGKFLDTTVARAVLDAFRSRQGSAPALLDPNQGTRDRILFAFDQLERVPSLPSPKLVFVHILSPHPPMVFGPNGEPISQAEFETTLEATGEAWLLQAYADQVTYLNRRLDAAVDAILDASAISPVIIIQGDHGWAERNAEDKLSIFNAIHLPAGGNARLYPTLTPVNTFRIVLDEYFAGDYELLDDLSYFSTDKAIFQFTEVPNTWTAPGP